VKRDIKVDIIVLTAPNTGYILKDTGWATYNGSQVEEIVFTDISSDSGITDLTVTASGIPVDGDLIIRLWPNTNTTNFQGFDYEDIVIKSGDEDRGTQSEQSLTAVIDENNNLSEDDIEFTIGQVPSNPNAELIHYGGLFDINGVAQEDWKRPGDTTAESLLKKVAIGYDLQNKQSSRQVTGTVIWDHDIWTNIDDQNKRLMINSINEWNMNTDEMTAEWVEVFEYKNTKGAFDLGFDDNFDNNTSDDYQTNTIFTITENYE